MKLNIDDVKRSLSAGIEFLVKAQKSDGHWEDYDTIPIGPSGGWITAYVGFALAETGANGNEFSGKESVKRAVEWLQGARLSPAGWGYNKKSGPDADSTAWALLLFQAAGQEIQERDVEWLLKCWKPEGGFATFATPNPRDMWGAPHEDVTPVAFSALPESYRLRKRWSFSWKTGLSWSTLTARFMKYALRTRRQDGTWPIYWWRACHYGTYWNLEVLRRLGWNEPVGPPVVTSKDSHRIHSAFDLAFVLGIALVGTRDKKIIEEYGAQLVSCQEMDGSWPGRANIRVTGRRCRPGEEPTGPLFEDDRHLLTTASVVRMLAKLNRSMTDG